MTLSHRCYCRHPFASASILVGVICVMAFSDPQVVAVQTGSPDICEVAQSFAAADRATIRVATANREQQLAAQQTWHQVLAQLAAQLPPGDARSAAQTLRSAQTVASDEPWTAGQENAYRVLARDLNQRCNVELPR